MYINVSKDFHFFLFLSSSGVFLRGEMKTNFYRFNGQCFFPPYSRRYPLTIKTSFSEHNF